MAKIVTITFNPCVDKNTTIEKLQPEKKLRCSKPVFGPGGGGINVSRALHNLGHKSLAIYPAGGHTGRFLNELMNAGGINTLPIQTGNFTRENLIVVETSTSKQFRFGMPGNEITNEECRQIIEEVRKADADLMVVSGSLLPGMSPELIATVATIAKEKNSRLVLDTSGEALKKAVEVGVYMLKPNLGELSSLAGKESISDDEVNRIGKSIIEKGLCEVLVVSMGEKGAKLITRTDVFFGASPDVETISTLGAGDSMVAGMCYAISRDFSFSEVLKWGLACGTAATMTQGSELCRMEDVEQLLARINITT